MTFTRLGVWPKLTRCALISPGVKSTALLFGDRTKEVLFGFAASNLALMSLSGYNLGVSWPFYASAVAGFGHMAWQLTTVDLNNGPDCMAKFVSNKKYGAIIFSGIVADRYLS